MDADITTIIGQLSIADSKWRNTAPNLVAVRQPQAADAPGAGKGDLFIVTEIQGNAENLEEMEQILAQTLRDSYYLARGSVTASLRRAIQTGSNLLYKRNRKVAADDRVVGGAVLLALCNDDAFVGQIGPAAFFAVLGDHIKRYPAQSVWLDEALGPDTGQNVTALGLKAVVEPGLHHLRVAAEDMLVLADSRLVGQLPLKSVVRAVSQGDVKTSIKNLAEAAQTRQGSALVLEVVEQTTGNRGPVKISVPPKLGSLWPRKAAHDELEPQPKISREDAPDPVLADEAGPETATATVFASTAAAMQRPLGWLGNLTRRPEPVPEPESPYQKTVAKYVAQVDQELEAAGSTTADTPLTPDTSHSPHYDRSYDADDDFETHGAAKRSSFNPVTALLTLVAILGGGIKKILGKLTPSLSEDSPRMAGAQAQQQSPGGFNWKLLRNIAIIIPILVAIIVSVSYIQKGRLREAEYQDYIAAAQTKFEQAKSVDPAAARALMSEAEAMLVQAEQIKATQPEIAQMRQQMAEQTDTVGNVQRLYYMPQLRRYTDPGTDTQNIVVQGVEVYVLDSGNDRIYHHRLDNLGEALLPDDETVLMTAKGQQVDNIAVADLLGMTWMPTGGNRQTSDLVILNSSGLLEYNPNWGIATSALTGSESLKLPAAVDSYFGNFYILDPQANALLRYLPTTDGYSTPPQSYFPADQTINLAGSVDMSIDGAIYVLYQNGSIKKFLGGSPADFNMTGLDVPLSNPAAIFTAPDEEVQHIYVADAGNQRIVQLNKDGSFVRQFKPRAGEAVSFANLQDLYVDEIGGRMFILDSNNLYLAKIPTDDPTATEEPLPPAETQPSN